MKQARNILAISRVWVCACAVLGFGTHLAARQESPSKPKLETATADLQKQLEESLAELAALREQMAAEKLPLARTLSEMETELSAARQEFQQTTRLLDNRTLDLTNLRTEIKSRQEEASYLSTLLAEYIRNFESRLHIAEVQRHRSTLDAARLAPEDTNLSQQDIYQQQAVLLTASLDRIEDLLGGARFDGTAVDATGLVRRGTYALIGPVAIFRSTDGRGPAVQSSTSQSSEVVGAAEQRLGSLESTILAFEQPEHIAAASQLITNGTGRFPLDPTQGNAHKIAETKETLWEHIKKGGPVMYPIFALAATAFLLAIIKWLQLLFVRKPSRKRVRNLLEAVARHDREGALKVAGRVRGPTGRMLVAGVQHLHEPRQLIEEVMYETVLATKLKLQRFLPFIAVSASAAPLLGLLGTVTGIMNTFTLITVFGTGDVKTLSSGISEALITTEYGLIVAIPSLLLHALLSRKARGIVDQMEKAAVAFANQVSKTPMPDPDSSADDLRVRGNGVASETQPNDSMLTARQVREMLEEMLGPVLNQRHSAEFGASRSPRAEAPGSDGIAKSAGHGPGPDNTSPRSTIVVSQV